MKTLLMFTGGYDSTYLAYKILTDTTDELTLVTMYDDNKLAGGLSRDNILKIQYVIKELKNYRPFKVMVHKVDATKVTSCTRDHWHNYSVHHFADQLNSGEYDRLASAVSWEQMDCFYHKHDKRQGLIRSRLDYHYTPDIVPRSKLWQPLVHHDIHTNYNRWHVFKHIPKKLGVLIDMQNHQNMDKVLFDLKTREFMAKGWTADDLDNWRHENSKDYSGDPNRDASFANWIKTMHHYPFPAKKGLALGGADIKFDVVTTKEEFREWYTTIKYNWSSDYKLMKWGLEVL